MPRKGKKQPQETFPDPYAIYNARAAIIDEALLKEANGGMDALMVFAGLFSAVIATLIQTTWIMLVPVPSDYTNQVLLSIYSATVHEQTSYPVPPEFYPDNSAVIINLLFFLSLILSLGAALGAMLVKEWARQYDPAAGYENIAWLKARDRHRRYEGYTKWPLRTIHAFLPMVLHAALLLFLVGVIIWTNRLNYRIYLTLLVTVATGIAGYLILAFIPTFAEASPFRWPFSQAIKVALHFTWHYIKKAVGLSTDTRTPRPSYIVSPLDVSTDTEKITQTKPSLYTVMDGAVLVDLLCKSSAHEELDAAMEALIGGEWANSSISEYLIKHEESIFQRYHDLALTCWDVESNCAWEDMSGRVRRLLRFLEWLYYQLTPAQRLQVTGWPDATLAEDARRQADQHNHLGDFVLAESVISKLHHLRLPRGTHCELCFDSEWIKPKYTKLRIAGTMPQHYAIYYQDLLSACIWSDTDCVLHYAPADSAESFKKFTSVALSGYGGVFSQLAKDVSKSIHPELYPTLRALLDERLQQMAESDARRPWFIAMDRVRVGEAPFPKDDNDPDNAVTSGKPVGTVGNHNGGFMSN